MKRDLDLVRKILLGFEELDELESAPPEINGYTEGMCAYHLRMIKEAGFAEGGLMIGTDGDVTFSANWHMTSHGHDFLDSIRDEGTWGETKSVLQKVGGWTLDLAAQTAKAIVVAKIQGITGGMS